MQEAFDVEVDWRGYELSPGTPLSGMSLEEKFGARVPAMHARVKAYAEELGIADFHPPMRSANTRKALAMTEYARDQGKLDAFRDAAMDAHWKDHRDLGSDEVLKDLATRAGLQPDTALQAAQSAEYVKKVTDARAEGDRMGVSGIPTFFFQDRYRIVGCQPFEVLAEVAEKLGAKRR